jgi:hypothetical protein
MLISHIEITTKASDGEESTTATTTISVDVSGEKNTNDIEVHTNTSYYPKSCLSPIFTSGSVEEPRKQQQQPPPQQKLSEKKKNSSNGL